LEIDYSISCDSPQFFRGACVAAATLVICVVLVPLGLVFKAKKSVRMRDISLGLVMSDVDAWFDEIDADGSGLLEMAEVRGPVWTVPACPQNRLLVIVIESVPQRGSYNPASPCQIEKLLDKMGRSTGKTVRGSNGPCFETPVASRIDQARSSGVH
jgi:hypothetical protein